MNTEKIITFGMLYLIWILLLGASILSIISAHWSIAFIAIITFILTLIPLFIQKKFKIYISHFFISFIAFFLYASIFLGEVNRFYEKIWWWDLLLHLMSAIGFGLLGAIILLLVFGKTKNKNGSILFAVLTFCFAVTIGVIWEIFEFSMDGTFGLNMQKSGLLDTMADLIINCIGAGIVSIMSYLYLTEHHTGFFSSLIEQTYKANKSRLGRKNTKKEQI